MAEELWITVPNWDKFQHYSDRDPVWIKNYLRLVHDENYLGLAPGARALLHGIWLLYAPAAGQLRTAGVRGALRMRSKREHWDSLVQAGFIQLSASKPLALTRARALAREEKEKEPPKPPTASASNAGGLGGEEKETLRPFRCPECGLRLKTEKRLAEHREIVHWVFEGISG